MIVTKVSLIDLAKAARELSLFLAQYYNVMPKKYKHTLGDIMITKTSNLNDCCRRACYIYDPNEKLLYLKEAELLIVDIVGTIEILFDVDAITTEHKAKFDIMAVGIGKQSSAMRKNAEKRLAESDIH